MEISSRHVIIVDWMPYTFRAWLMSPSGHVLRHMNTQDGVFEISNRQFGSTLLALCSTWIKQHDDAVIYLFGTIGSADGWIEVPNLKCPASIADILKGAMKPISTIADVNTQLTKRGVTILPGAHYAGENGEVALMRAPASAALGLGLKDGVVCIPGQQAKWIEIKNSKIERFYAFSSFEMMGLLRRMFNLAHVRDHDMSHSLFDRGLNFSWRKTTETVAHKPNQGLAVFNIGTPNLEETTSHAPSLSRMSAEIRHHIILGNMHPRQLSGFIAGIVIGDEITDVWRLMGQPKHVHLIADDDDKIHYERAITLKGAQVESYGFAKTLYQFLMNANQQQVTHAADEAQPQKSILQGSSLEMPLETPLGMREPPFIKSITPTHADLPILNNILAPRSSGDSNIF